MRRVENCNVTNRQQKGITLSAILNVIDGVAAQEGRILVMTTNHIEKLDPALRRPDRVDMQIGFGAVNRFSAQEHFLMFYLEPPNALCMGIRDEATGAVRPVSTPASSEWKVDDIAMLAMEFANAILSGKYTAAELQNYLLQHRNDPESAAHW
jgi:chaperone BCS1